jgi:trimeric autotransporter adhesin
MGRRGHWGSGCWRALGSAALLVSLALPQVVLRAPVPVQAAVAVPGPSVLATYAGGPAAGKPTDVAQQPFGLAVIGRYTFVADPINHLVRVLIDNKEYAFAGNGSMAVAVDGTDLSKSQLSGPYGVAIGHVSGTPYQLTDFDVYIADTFANQIRRVSVHVPTIDSASGSQSASITTIAGTGAFGFSGEGQPATSAQLNSPYGVAWDESTKLVYVADTLNNCIRTIDASGTIATLIGPCVGSGRTAVSPLNHPRGLASDGNGKLYIADTYNNVVRLYDQGSEYKTPRAPSVSVVAGIAGTAGYKDSVLGTAAQLRMPAGVALDSIGNLFIADTGNSVVRELSAADSVIRTVAGTGSAGESGDGGPAMLAQLSSPMAVAVRPNGDVVIGDSGNNLLRVLEGTLSNGPAHNIHVEAGNGTASFAGDGLPPAMAQFSAPAAVVSQLAANGLPPNAAVPAVAGRRFVIDTFNQTIRTFATTDTDPDNHTTSDKDADEVSTLAGLGGVRGTPSTSPQPLAGSRFANPMGSALDATRNVLYVADTFNDVVRAIDLTTNTVTTVAGTPGQSGYAGDGKAATSALLSYPTGLAVDQAGDLFIADTYNGRIREVVGGTIYTVAGTGRLGFSGEGGSATQADLYFPYGVTVDASTPPNLFVTDSFNHRVREVAAVSPLNPQTRKPLDSHASNVITTVAGSGAQGNTDGATASAQFDRPWSSALDQHRLFVADYLNQRVRQIDMTAATVSTLAGSTGVAGLAGDFGPATTAEVNGPRGLSVLGDSGALLVADSFNDRVRWLGVTQAGIARTQVNFDPTNLAGSSVPQSVTVSSTGSGLLVMGAVDLGQDRSNFVLDPVRNTCAQARLEPGTSCSFDVAFQPRAPGGHVGSVVVPDDATGGQQVIMLKGQATAAIVTLDPPGVVINQAANAQPTPTTVTLTNNGDGQLHISSIALDPGTDPDFSQSNDCPSVMAGHSSCSIKIVLNQIASGDSRTREGSLTVRDDAAGSGTAQTVPLSGGLAAPQVSFNHTSLVFTQNLGTRGQAEVVNLQNTGQVPLHLSDIHESGDFVQSNNCPQALAPGASCAISVNFLPTTIGERDGYIVIADDSVDSPQRISVMGIGTVAMAKLGTNRLAFNQNVGDAGTPQTVTLTNGGDGPLTITGIATTGDFQASPHCPSVLAPGLVCQIGISFVPKVAGVNVGSLVVSDDAFATPGSQQTVRLDGFGYQPVATLSTSILSPGANLGGSAGPQTITVTNTGDGALTIRAISVDGPAAGEYRQASDCLRTIAPGASCSITVTFTPHGYGLRAATLTLHDDGLNGSQSVALNGSGTAPRPLLSNPFVNFGGDAVGNPMGPDNIVLFNAGTGPLSIGNVVLSGADYLMSSSCGVSLDSGASCTISITFVPQGMGVRTGVVTITDSAGTQRIGLSGVGT